MSDDRGLEQVLTGDAFVGHMCLVCGMHAALFTVRGEHVALCPKCVSSRISRLSEGNSNLPEWIKTLWASAIREERYQVAEDAREFELRWDDLYKCQRCGKIIHESDARYYSDSGSSVSAPHCQSCFDALSGSTN